MAPARPLIFYNNEPQSCPFAQRVWIALKEKGIEYEIRKVDLNNKPQDFLDLYASINPDPDARAKVPIVIDGEDSIIESNIVVEYLDEKYQDTGLPLLPEKPADRAKVRLFMEAFTNRVLPQFYAFLSAQGDEALDIQRANFAKCLKFLDDFVTIHGRDGDGDYFFGAQYSIAEVSTAPFLIRAALLLPHFRDFDLIQVTRDLGLTRLDKWMKATIERTSTRETTPDPPTLIQSALKFVKPCKCKPRDNQSAMNK